MKNMAMDSPSPMDATVMKVLRLFLHMDRQARGKITILLPPEYGGLYVSSH